MSSGGIYLLITLLAEARLQWHLLHFYFYFYFDFDFFYCTFIIIRKILITAENVFHVKCQSKWQLTMATIENHFIALLLLIFVRVTSPSTTLGVNRCPGKVLFRSILEHLLNFMSHKQQLSFNDYWLITLLSDWFLNHDLNPCVIFLIIIIVIISLIMDFKYRENLAG